MTTLSLPDDGSGRLAPETIARARTRGAIEARLAAPPKPGSGAGPDPRKAVADLFDETARDQLSLPW